MVNSPSTCPIFTLRDFPLQSGQVLQEARLAYQTYGTLNSARSNVILYPTSYGAHHCDIEWLIGPGRILDPTQYFIIIPNMFGNGLSSSPSNFTEALTGPQQPVFTHLDNINAQRQLLWEQFGIEQLALVYGYSMGGQQALHWGALHPERVQRIAAICTSAKTSPHNYVFLEGLKGALTADPAWNGERFVSKPERGLRAFGRVYAGWALSQTFYRQKMYLELGYASLEDFLVRDWEASFLRRDAGNLLAMIQTWQRSDISDNDQFRGDLPQALRSIRARTFLMPCQTDLYFPVEDNQAEIRQMSHAELRPIPSIWGHRAGNPSKNPADETFLRTAIADLLSA
ncbi:alpha/beta fold hydrolase [Planctomicrobium sp. SH661]|uniref:alpha/beta fold hydrolase n=1 Tax=Planctomicrobium sp. SH661 TaxID=3448124 RepID=UPI003F5C3C0B